VVPAKPAADEVEAASAIEVMKLELAEAQDTVVRQHDKLAAQARRMEQLEAELKMLEQELLRRNRTIGDLANRLAAYERV
jgi:septal ring factor EnvC (AmiA/AmiB activator)